MKEWIIFNNREGLLRVPVEHIVYIEADGNYSCIVTRNKLKGVVAISLARLEQQLSAELGEGARAFMRIGKRFIIATKFVYSINLAKQHLVLSDSATFAFQLPVSKEALRAMRNLFLE